MTRTCTIEVIEGIMPSARRNARSGARQFTERLGNGVTLHMMRIPAGTFLMGAPESEADSRSTERPQRQVAVAPFCLGKHPSSSSKATT